MDYLNDDELLKVIGDYIDSKSKYAILIDGEWGCGKTEFANGKLIEYLREKNKNNENKNKENDGICYISLYGLTTKQEIENEITAKMIEQLDITGSIFLARCFKSTKLLSKIINMGLDEKIKSLVDKINIEEIVNKAVKDKIVNYHGRTNDVPKALHESRFFIYPSYYPEGVPRCSLQALSSGRPIITCNTQGCKETVKDGFNGFIIEPKDSKVLAEKMIYMINNPKRVEKMAKESRTLAELAFDVYKINEILIKKIVDEG